MILKGSWMNNLPENLKLLLEDKNTVPSVEKVFRAFSYFPPKATKVIIIGSDPYPKRQDASGLAFSTDSAKIPGSLRNIFKELRSDLGVKMPKSGSLEKWAIQGVLLLNPVLTTRSGKSKAHSNKGWQEFTLNKVQKILDYNNPVVIIAWGKSAQEFVFSLKRNDNVHVLFGAHPSLNNTRGGFRGGRYFSQANRFLNSHGIQEIDWKL